MVLPCSLCSISYEHLDRLWCCAKDLKFIAFSLYADFSFMQFYKLFEFRVALYMPSQLGTDF